MKLFVGCAIFVMVAAFATASSEADAGYFIPKAFYTLDAEGHKTQPHAVSPHTAQYLRRLRRQAYSSSSSSSSSSVSSNGGPVYFNTQNTVSHSPGGVSSISSRFGDDGSSSVSSHSSSGVPALNSGVAIGYGSHSGSNYGSAGAVHFPSNGNNYPNNYDDTNNYGSHNTGFASNSHSNDYDSDYNSAPIASRFGSSASSSSAVSSNGGPVHFKTEQSVSHTPTDNFSSRFGGDDDKPATVSKTVSTSGYIDSTGVHAKTTTTKNH